MAKSYIILYGVLVIIAFPMFLQVQGLTLVSRPPSVTYVELGKTLTLNVTYEDKGTVLVSWVKDGNNLCSPNFGCIDPRASLSGQGTLVLGNTTLSDNGTFQHLAQTAKLLKPIFMTVIIQVRPTAVIHCSDSTTVKEGENVECLCNSTRGNPPPIASWYKDGTLVGEPGYLKQNLSLKNISKENAGNYSCIVKSYDLNDTKQVEIQVLYKPTITSFISDQKNNTVSVGKNVTITCKAEAFPAPNYMIFHDRTQLTEAVNGVKTIKSVNLSYDGRYECVAYNSVGNVSKSFNLTVKVRPTANTTCPTNVTVNEGEQFECLCFGIGGNPPPSASWYEGGTNTEYLNKTLSLKNISRKDAGTYTCVVKSLDLNDTKQVNIQVHYKPTNISFKSEQGNIVSNGTSVTITCKAEAFPEPNYIIFHNDERLLVRVHGTKTINPVNLCDNGHYKCVAKNSLGNVSASLNLIVKVPYEFFAVTSWHGYHLLCRIFERAELQNW